MLFQLQENNIEFPPCHLAEPDGLLAIGGDLTSARLLSAYAQGIFPWFSEGDPICWFAPPERCVLFPGKVKISKSMQRSLRKDFTITMNQAFAAVIRHCATVKRKDQQGTWITSDMREAYIRLHHEGHAHSVEVWSDHILVGGLYGIRCGSVFCGESMFSLKSNASKAALIFLCQQEVFQLIDCQVPNDHLLSMGAEMISRKEYLRLLHEGREG